VTLEIKGSAGVQRIPLELHPDWSPAEQERGLDGDRHAVGGRRLGQAAGGGGPASGAIDLDVRFERLPLFRKLATYRAASSAASCWSPSSRPCWRAWRRGRPPARGPRVGLLRDAVQGAGAVAIAGLSIGVYALSSRGADGGRLAPARLRGRGVVLGEWWKYGLTGRHLTPAEALRDGLATGLLAASPAPWRSSRRRRNGPTCSR
jgi:hypothetical protein